MSTIFGIDIYPNACLTETVTEVGRVRGGYLNRWLIRAVVTKTRPSRKVIYDTIHNRLYCHPAVLQEIKLAMEKEYPSPFTGALL